MEHGQFGHFLIYQILLVILIYGGILGFIGLGVYFHKSKKRNLRNDEKKPEKIQLLWDAKSSKRRRRKK